MGNTKHSSWPSRRSRPAALHGAPPLPLPPTPVPMKEACSKCTSTSTGIPSRYPSVCCFHGSSSASRAWPRHLPPLVSFPCPCESMPPSCCSRLHWASRQLRTQHSLAYSGGLSVSETSRYATQTRVAGSLNKRSLQEPNNLLDQLIG